MFCIKLVCYMAEVKFGVMLPVFVPSASYKHILPYYESLDYEAVRNMAVEAEKLGYHSVWVADHLSSEAIGRSRLECWTTLSALASATKRIRLGTMVLCNLFRNPSLLAKMASTLDVISGGRLEFGIGAGWAENECLDYGIEFPSPSVRIEMLKEAVKIVKGMWTQEQTYYEGIHYRVKGAYCEPKPLQKPHPPITIGGGGEKLTLKLVAEEADRSNFGGTPPEFERKLQILRTHCERVGRDFDEIEKSCNLSVLICQDKEELNRELKKRFLAQGSKLSFEEWVKQASTNSVIGTPEKCLDRLKEYTRLGASLFTVQYFGDMPSTRGMKLFAESVASRF